MGIPAEGRRIVRHLLNISNPYDYDNPNFALLCPGIEELTENFEPDTEDVQYICEQTKTRNVKGYTVGFDLSLKYIKDSRLQKWADRLLRNPPIGQATSCDYIRFNICEQMFGKDKSYIAVRRKATVEVNSIGGSATDSMTTVLHITAASDPEIGYVTVENSDTDVATFKWAKASANAPIISSPEDGYKAIDGQIAIKGYGLPKATVTVSYMTDKNTTMQSLPDAITVGDDGTWTTTLDAKTKNLTGKITIAATQKDEKNNESISSNTVSVEVPKSGTSQTSTSSKDSTNTPKAN